MQGTGHLEEVHEGEKSKGEPVRTYHKHMRAEIRPVSEGGQEDNILGCHLLGDWMGGDL